MSPIVTRYIDLRHRNSIRPLKTIVGYCGDQSWGEANIKVTIHAPVLCVNIKINENLG